MTDLLCKQDTQEAELKYTFMERLALALITSTRNLHSYFLVHAVKVVTNHPLKSILAKPEYSGRLVKWAIELNEFDI